MITLVNVKDQATYHGDHVFGPLAPVNYVFGCNGTGKSTLARVIDEPDKYANCSIQWKAKPLQRFVYDRIFVANNFKEELPGVFTLGQKDIEILEKIEKARDACNASLEEVNRFTRALDGDGNDKGARGHKDTLISVFDGACWVKRTAHQPSFPEAMRGHIKTQALFAKKVLAEQETNTAALLPLATLQEKQKKLFGTEPTKVEKLIAPQSSVLAAHEANSILSKVVVGKDDVGIAALIKKLGNSDWVDQGRAFLAKSEGNCPFCQQRAPADLKDSLEAYFDESFKNDIIAISTMEARYRQDAAALRKAVAGIVELKSSFLQDELVKSEQKLIDARIDANLRAIEDKKSEPSRSVSLESIEDICKPLNDLIATANGEIDAHNTMVDNLGNERKQFTDEVWMFILNELKTEIASHKKEIIKAIDKLKQVDGKLKTAQEQLQDRTNELHKLEKSTTSIRPTINEINDILASFGFQGYKLAEGKGKNSYQIVRPNGQPAHHTLSEGEKTFITFLYFYHLLKGSKSESGTLEDRIVVFDDPVSSLDSNILYIVSTLIRRIAKEIDEGKGIKQLIVLTHNVFFHKEVSFRRRRDATGYHKFWVVRKNAEKSKLEDHDNKNPVKSSYERLWAEIRDEQAKSLSPHLLQNTMRRIIESYFGILGNIEINDLDEKFTGTNKLACRALMAWVQDGSHSIHDDLNMMETEASAETFLHVFKEIFRFTKHLPHYEMMMGVPIQFDSALPA